MWLSHERRPTITREEMIDALRRKYEELLSDDPINSWSWAIDVRDILEAYFAEEGQ